MGDSADPKLLWKVASFADKYEKHEFLRSIERVSDLLGSPRSSRNMVAVGATWLEDHCCCGWTSSWAMVKG